jgi:hypothetical protein
MHFRGCEGREARLLDILLNNLTLALPFPPPQSTRETCLAPHLLLLLLQLLLLLVQLLLLLLVVLHGCLLVVTRRLAGNSLHAPLLLEGLRRGWD